MALLESILNQNDLFDPLWGFFDKSDGSAANTPMDWKETPHSHVFQFDLPGFTKEDLKLEVHEGRVLHLSAEKKAEEDRDDEAKNEKTKLIKWHCKERISSGGISRHFRLPENVKVDEMNASMHDGVLVVTVPKDESKKKYKHQRHKVEISGDNHEGNARKGLGRFVCCKA